MLPGGEPEEPEDDASERGSSRTVQSVVRSSGHASASRGRMPKVRLRIFHGEAYDYLEWKREVLAIKEPYRVSDDHLSGLVYLGCEA